MSDCEEHGVCGSMTREGRAKLLPYAAESIENGKHPERWAGRRRKSRSEKAESG